MGAGVYQRLSDRLETGVQLNWVGGTNETRFALASKYQVDNQTTLAARVNNTCQLGLSLQQMLRPGNKKISSEIEFVFSFFFVVFFRREIDFISVIRSSKSEHRWTSSRHGLGN